MKRLFPIIFIAVIAFLIYQKSPFFKSKVDAVTNKWTTWTDEQIKENPGKFLDHAEAKIKENLTGLKDSQGTLTKNINELTEKRDANQFTVTKADEFAAEFKAAYKDAEANSSWPITVRDTEYTKETLVTQVDSIMFEKGTLEPIIATQTSNIDKASASLNKLKSKVTELDGELTTIASKRTTLENDKALAEADEWLAKINKQVEDSGNVEGLTEGPMAIEDIMKQDADKALEEAKAEAEKAKKQKTLDFLDS